MPISTSDNHHRPAPATRPSASENSAPPGFVANPIPKGDSESAGDQMQYASLAAAFNEANHKVYYDLLVRAINTDGVRNVALTGAYGTGKSSVLAELRREKGDSVVQLSLSTISPPEREAGEAREPGDTKDTNFIQKEIVKQLLYLLPPEETPRSRFQRASKPNRRRDSFVAWATGVGVVGVLLLLGLLQPPVERLVPEPAWRWWATYALAIGLITAFTWGVRHAVSGRLSVSASLGNGLTTVTLSEKSDTYFDEYLDEIVYFFQESLVDIVVIEDIDRFEDVLVFDTLRALNGLLNGAGSLSRIVFIYAIRDSVFERIGSTRSGKKNTDPAAKAVDLASRTKFFDVIVPVVPFLSADNARDLMSRVMTSAEFSINQGLIRTAARHTADMRLIHNIRNEFEVYRNQLVIPEDHLYDIDDDLVFAMVLYKNTHLGDFERIRHKASNLDDLYVSWRRLVNESLTIEVDELARLRESVAQDELAEERARHLGTLALALGETLLAGLRASHPASVVTLAGAATGETIRNRAAWAQIAAGSALEYRFADERGRRALTMAFGPDDLGTLLETEIDADEWGEVDRTEIGKRVTGREERIHFLRHHTWEQLCSRPEFKLKIVARSAPEASSETALGTTPTSTIRPAEHTGESAKPNTKFEEVTFDQLIDRHLPTPLAREMVRKGYITAHFALFTSTYYGTHLGPDALEYVRRCIEPGTPDALYELPREAVEQILIEQGASTDDGADIFEDPSIFNVSILDYLLTERPLAAKRVAAYLSTWGAAEAEFVDTYCARGARPDLLLSAMTPSWKGSVQYAATEAPVSHQERIKVVDAVLNNLSTAEGYETDRRFREFIEATYRDAKAVTQPSDAVRASIVLAVVGASHAILDSVKPLNNFAREVVVERRMYPITEENLRELLGSATIPLDELASRDERIFNHAINRIDEYLSAFADSSATHHTIENPTQFLPVLNLLPPEVAPASLSELIEHACACQVSDLADAPTVSWPHLVRGGRAEPNFANAHAYVAEYGVDDALGVFLTVNPEIDWDESSAPIAARHMVAVAVVNAHEAIPSVDVRVNAATHLEPGAIDPDELDPEPGELPAKLIEKKILADDADTFASKLMTDWPTRESAIRVSNDFASLVSPHTLPCSEVPQFLHSGVVGQDVKKAAVDVLESLLADASSDEAEAIARALNATAWQIPSSRIRALIERGVSDREIVGLVARETRLDVTKLRDLLRLMGGEYPRLADVGTRPVHLLDNPEHRSILNMLTGATVSTYKVDKRRPRFLRVNLLKTER